MSRPLRVLIVDDSSVVRKLLQQILGNDPEFEIVGMAPDPYVARDLLVQLKPDLMTLDIEMPRMDGITFLEKVMEHFPTRTVILSSLSAEGSALALRALELGAVDVMEKPSLDVAQSLQGMAAELRQRLKAAGSANLQRRVLALPVRRPGTEVSSQALSRTTHQVIAVASSTGGTEALKVLLPMFPVDLPGTVVVQHMPAVFTKTYADHLQQLCPFEVKEAQEGDKVIPGRVLIAPGNFHMELVRSGGYYQVILHQKPPMHGVRPAADYLMQSVAKYAGANAIGIVLTGMGKDGAKGLLEMKKAGSFNVAQDEASSVIYGMPKAAVEIGAIDAELPLDRIAARVMQQFQKKAA